ncbi:glycerophosphodiester phosphodiesterase [Candidatus Palauibacter polyketidifaciens]|uniref:glycerophosphodiester phosphodiesterase n=1 Tax=Candidatus Palauibacter polyketidifaciens TaxID=3056740 RepID=UPI00139DAE0A|nr:glycerophosphodiester phosphodiesterase [Candidatus Palauibacter polyketidifaciens]MDE2720637.1 glycerophosphodiester phosphodiesterase [Candidatus Palauibacter polyketidifaciens]MYE34133.1 glycerophosphodiester phosphodiesterase [Gemmatimonadales bacterium]
MLPDDLFGPGSPLRVIGHRGAAAFAPENTLPSFEHAVRVGADAVELDLHRSADGRLMVIHDPSLDRLTEGTGPVEERTLDELRAFDAGYRFTTDRGKTFPFRGTGVGIPTLEEVLEVLGDLPVVAEIKSAAAGHELGAWLQRSRNRADRERILVGGFERGEVEPASRHARWHCAYQDELRTYVLLGKVGLGRRFAPAGCAAAMLPERQGALRIVTPRFVRRAHADGMGVFVWTVNRADDMRRLLDWGVDGLVSDSPGRARRILDEREMWGHAGA